VFRINVRIPTVKVRKTFEKQKEGIMEMQRFERMKMIVLDKLR